MYNRISTLVREVGIDYIKWDMNRPFAEVTMHHFDRNPREAWVLHVQGFYSVLDRLKKDFPHLWIESCSSGGGRMDIGVLEKVDQVWTSDNTRPDARIMIQYGASLFLPPRAMYGWVTDSPSDPSINIPLSFRFHVSFMGGLGVGANLNQYTEEQMAEAKGWIALYKKIRPVIQNGDLNWLVQPSKLAQLVAVSQTTARDQSRAVVLGFRLNSPFSQPLSPVRLRDLEASATYRVQVWEDDPENPTEDYTYSGAYLMNKGITFSALNNAMFRSVVAWVQEV